MEVTNGRSHWGVCRFTVEVQPRCVSKHHGDITVVIRRSCSYLESLRYFWASISRRCVTLRHTTGSGVGAAFALDCLTDPRTDAARVPFPWGYLTPWSILGPPAPVVQTDSDITSPTNPIRLL